MTINAYPLQWPVGWKRTDHFQRLQAKFGKASRSEGYGENRRWVAGRELTIAEAVERVLLELKRMGLGREDVVISSDLRVRLDGLPRSDQREPEDPGVAVYWETAGGGRKVMAIDIYLRVADNLAAVAATLEAMRSIERHGGAAILDRAFTGFTALPAPMVMGGKRNWWDVLGVAHNASREEIEQAHRRLRSELHPDKKGGSHELMAELNAARDEALGEAAR